MELLHSIICLLSICCRFNLAAYVGLSSSKDTLVNNGEFDKSQVPMIRLFHQQFRFLKPSLSANISPTDNGISEKGSIRALPSSGRKFADILKRSRSINLDGEESEADTSSNISNEVKNVNEETEEERTKEFLAPIEGSCTVDGQKVLNSEEIFQNECGTLQCLNSEVTWSLKPLAKTLPHCEGIKSIPSMFNSYTKIKIVDEDDEESRKKMISGKTSNPTRIDADIIDQRKKLEEASRKMIEAEKWD